MRRGKNHGCGAGVQDRGGGILVSVLNQVLTRSGREEQATMTTLAGLIVVLMMVVQKISELFELVKTLFGL